jgi:hypothetical protein
MEDLVNRSAACRKNEDDNKVSYKGWYQTPGQRPETFTRAWIVSEDTDIFTLVTDKVVCLPEGGVAVVPKSYTEHFTFYKEDVAKTDGCGLPIPSPVTVRLPFEYILEIETRVKLFEDVAETLPYIEQKVRDAEFEHAQ